MVVIIYQLSVNKSTLTVKFEAEIYVTGLEFRRITLLRLGRSIGFIKFLSFCSSWTKSF